MEKKMESNIMGSVGLTGLYWGSIGIMGKKMETTIMGSPEGPYIQLSRN